MVHTQLTSPPANTNRGEVWVFGGWGFDEDFSVGMMGDLWRSVPPYNNWTYAGGDRYVKAPSVVSADSVAGLALAADTTVKSSAVRLALPGQHPSPGARCCAASATDGDTKVGFLFGGLGHYDDTSYRILNELWIIDLVGGEGGGEVAGRWRLVGGELGSLGADATYTVDPAAPDAGRWGTWPAARRHAGAVWFSNRKQLYVFGGQYDASYLMPCSDAEHSKALWRYTVNASRVGGGDWNFVGPVDVAAADKGTAAAAADPTMGDLPPPRDRAVAWSAPNSNFIQFFGGCGDNKYGQIGVLGTVWAYGAGELGNFTFPVAESSGERRVCAPGAPGGGVGVVGVQLAVVVGLAVGATWGSYG